MLSKIVKEQMYTKQARSSEGIINKVFKITMDSTL
jgi:hypothetical protein